MSATRYNERKKSNVLSPSSCFCDVLVLLSTLRHHNQQFTHAVGYVTLEWGWGRLEERPYRIKMLLILAQAKELALWAVLMHLRHHLDDALV